MSDKIEFKILSEDYIDEIAFLGQQLNTKLTVQDIKNYLVQMFTLSHYKCFGVLVNDKLVGISSGWTSIRFYCGKQLEVDNVFIDSSLQSQGIGKRFFEFIENWAKENQYESIELNTYVTNSKSHKFYFNLGYSILGFHFIKRI